MRQTFAQAWPLILLSSACAPAAAPTALESVDPPASAGSSAPVLCQGGDGRLRLAWTEPSPNGGHALRLSELEGERWSEAGTIAEGDDWFVNWADVPALAALSDGTLFATWLEKLGEGTYTYGVRWARSQDGGGSWEPGGFLHEDLTATEHGFVSLEPLDARTMRAVWLDGRGHGAAAGHGHGGHAAMALYTRTITSSGELGPELELDARVCDCCPTALQDLGEGRALALYRDRSDDERRDMGLARIEAEGAADVRELHLDGWILDGCPVNGAVLARHGDTLAAIWFTAADDLARVRVVFSSDGGESFGEPLELARDGVLGALSGSFDDAGTLWITWLSSRAGEGLATGAWSLLGVDPLRGVLGEAIELVETPPARVSGIARLVHHGGRAWFAWVEVSASGDTRVRAARVRLPATATPQEKNR